MICSKFGTVQSDIFSVQSQHVSGTSGNVSGILSDRVEFTVERKSSGLVQMEVNAATIRPNSCLFYEQKCDQ